MGLKVGVDEVGGSDRPRTKCCGTLFCKLGWPPGVPGRLFAQKALDSDASSPVMAKENTGWGSRWVSTSWVAPTAPGRSVAEPDSANWVSLLVSQEAFVHWNRSNRMPRDQSWLRKTQDGAQSACRRAGWLRQPPDELLRNLTLRIWIASWCPRKPLCNGTAQIGCL